MKMLMLILVFSSTALFAGDKVKTYTKKEIDAEIVKHGTVKDCWTIMKGKVYNLNPILKAGIHKAMFAKVLPACGKDGTAVFNAKGGMGTHVPASVKALDDKKYLIGIIK